MTRWLTTAAGLAIAGVFVVRAVIGVPAALAYNAGRVLRHENQFEAAGPLLDRGIAGGERTETLWRAGRARLSLWETLSNEKKVGPVGDQVLRVAAHRFLEGRRASPASALFISGLAAVYGDRESIARSRRLTDLSALSSGPWALLGDDGRIAIGLIRAAIERSPNSYEFRDQLVVYLLSFGFHEEALAAIEDSAKVLPDFRAHPSFSATGLARDLQERFWSTSRSLGPRDTPLMPFAMVLLSAGQMGHRLGHLAEAEQDYRKAMTMPVSSLMRAEQQFYLGHVLIDAGRFAEAEELFTLALREPSFGAGVAEARARIAEKQGRWADALEHIRELRRLLPRDVGVLLRFAGIARKAGTEDQAEEALRWAILVAPDQPSPRLALVELLHARKERHLAARALDDYIRSFGRTPEAIRWEEALAAPLDPAAP